MNSILEEMWLDYAERWFSDNTYINTNLQLKIEHSRRVCHWVSLMAEHQGLSETTQRCAHAAALLHDTGRFPQFSKHESFNDQFTGCHGTSGAIVVEEEGWLNAFKEEERTGILEAIRHHNAHVMPGQLTPLGKQLTELIRDGDRVDILYFAAFPDKSRRFAEEKIDKSRLYNPEIPMNLLASNPISYASLCHPLDRPLQYLSFIYQLTQKGAADIIHAYDMVPRICKSFPNDPVLTKAVTYIKAELEKRRSGLAIRLETATYEKLVRDRIPEVIRAHGKTPVVSILPTTTSIQKAILLKVSEELEEFTLDPCAEELADLLETVEALGKAYQIDEEEVQRIKTEKYHERGGFEKGVWLDSVLKEI